MVTDAREKIRLKKVRGVLNWRVWGIYPGGEGKEGIAGAICTAPRSTRWMGLFEKMTAEGEGTSRALPTMGELKTAYSVEMGKFPMGLATKCVRL